MSWKYKKGSGLWEEWENEQTGEKSIKEIKPKVIAEYCHPDDHYFEEEGSTRTCYCTKCNAVVKYVLGMYKLEKGKLIPLS